MESKNYKIIKNFLDAKTKKEVIDYVNSINESITLENHHLKHIVSKINGNSYMYDISKTPLTQKLTLYQSGGRVMENNLPPLFTQLIEKITKIMEFPKDQVFLQIVDMNTGGTISKHYDAAYNGFINYKCNISVLSEEYDFCIDNNTIRVEEGDMYCFEASLYKHWTPQPFTYRRILLSFGFLIPYKTVGRDENDPRVRLSKRIEHYFQK